MKKFIRWMKRITADAEDTAKEECSNNSVLEKAVVSRTCHAYTQQISIGTYRRPTQLIYPQKFLTQQYNLPTTCTRYRNLSQPRFNPEVLPSYYNNSNPPDQHPSQTYKQCF